MLCQMKKNKFAVFWYVYITGKGEPGDDTSEQLDRRRFYMQVSFTPGSFYGRIITFLAPHRDVTVVF